MSQPEVIKLSSEVLSCSLVTTDKTESSPPSTSIQELHEKVERPLSLPATVYKLKSPLYSHAVYITISDIELGDGDKKVVRPFEIFFNTKTSEHSQYLTTISRLLSAVMRKGGDVSFLVEELHSIYAPSGYWKKGRFIPSVIFEIGDIIENHLQKLGLIQKKVDDKPSISKHVVPIEENEQSDIVPNALICPACGAKSLVSSEGCFNCLNCPYSKCG